MEQSYRLTLPLNTFTYLYNPLNSAKNLLELDYITSPVLDEWSKREGIAWNKLLESPSSPN